MKTRKICLTKSANDKNGFQNQTKSKSTFCLKTYSYHRICNYVSKKYWILVSKNPPIHHHLTCSNIIKIPKKKRKIHCKIQLVSKLNLNNHIDIVRNWGQQYFEWRLSNWILSLWCVSVRCAHYNCYLYAWIKLPSIDNRLFNQTNKTILIKVL